MKSLAALTFLLGAIFYIGPKVFLPPISAIDFKYFWLAGDLWKNGINPYAPVYLERAQEIFTVGNVPQQWAYPPHFRLVAEPMAWAPFEISAYLWKAFNVVCVAGGVVLVILAIRPTLHLAGYQVAVAVAVSLTMSATAISVSIGQSSTLIFLGYCAFVFAYLTERRVVMVIALMLLMIKPTYGLIPAFFLLAHFRHFGTIIIAGTLTVAVTVWTLWGVDLALVAQSVLTAFEKYADTPVNSAPEMTGLRHLVYLSGIGETSQLIYVLVGIGLAFWLGWSVDRRARNCLGRLRGIALLGLLILVFAPLHTYDGYLALASVLPALALTRAERITGLVLLLLYWRSNNLAQLTGLKSPESLFSPGSTIEALAAMGALMIFVAVLLRQGYSVTASVPSR